jgi:hypothetical protein
MKIFQKGFLGVVLGGARSPVSPRPFSRRPPVPHDLDWVLSLNFVPQYHQNKGKGLEDKT